MERAHRVKKKVGILMEIALNLLIVFGRRAIFTISILPIHERVLYAVSRVDIIVENKKNIRSFYHETRVAQVSDFSCHISRSY